MSTDERQAQARAEAERRNPGQSNISHMKREEFMRGWLAADANPKPHTITRAHCEDAMALLRPDIYGDVTGVEDMLESLGIEVTGDE